MLIALALDPALALRDLRRQPRHVEVVERLQPELRVDARPHRVGGTDQEADLAGAHVTEQALLGLGLLDSCMKAISDAGTPMRTSSSLTQR